MKYICFDYKKIKGSFDYDDLILNIGTESIKYEVSNVEEPRRLYLIFSKSCNLNCGYCFQKNDIKNF